MAQNVDLAALRHEIETRRTFAIISHPDAGKTTLTEKLLHIVTTSRFESIFEVIRHGMSRADAIEYIRLLSRYHRAGFFAIFGLQL